MIGIGSIFDLPFVAPFLSAFGFLFLAAVFVFWAEWISPRYPAGWVRLLNAFGAFTGVCGFYCVILTFLILMAGGGMD